MPTLVLYGEDDHVLDTTFPAHCRAAFTECIGPFVLQDCGHFVQWEAAGVLNAALRWFCADSARSWPGRSHDGHGAASSRTLATRNITGSPRAGASTWTPTGRSCAPVPNGTLIAA